MRVYLFVGIGAICSFADLAILPGNEDAILIRSPAAG